ncbi:hypothetical protein AAFG07_23490 [Bradyrhizobium sp. B097]|uniref:hypothetical protein n=1 Tax=Bradyrhizobium sp. B097 TaxID=3140244 RepID=UPI003183E058
MSDDETPPSSRVPKVTGLDILKNVGGALTIAFLIYWIPIVAEQFYSPTEIRFHRVTLGQLSGYLFSIQNYSRRPIDDLSFLLVQRTELAPFFTMAPSQSKLHPIPAPAW